MSNDYEFGKEHKLDELRARHNISEILKGRKKKKGNLTNKFTAWKEP